MSQHACPVCSTDAPELIETTHVDKLVDSYRKKGIDIEPYFRVERRTTLCRCPSCDLRFFSPAPAGDEGFYEQLQVQDWYYQEDKPEYLFAKDLVPEHASVLEVGCGKGAFRAYLPPSVSYTGLEFNDEAIRKARDKGLDVVKQPIEQYAGQGILHDVVCSFQVLEHVDRPGSFFHACAQALKPGGTLIIAVPAQDSFLAIAANSPLNMPPHHLTRWTDLALSNLAQREGFRKIELWHEPVAHFHQDWHATTLALYALSDLGLFKWRLIDDSLGYRLAARLSRPRWIRDHLASMAAKKRPELRAGHTVVMVAQDRLKPAQELSPVSATSAVATSSLSRA
jgi:2-polyprenyl-3-methyl-5-hydroxy-6-metoxy-1,4-benzoquinol methylase